MATKTNEEKSKSHFNEPEVVEEKKEEPLTPAQYFDIINNKMNEETADNVKMLFNVTINKLKKYMTTGQKKGAKELYSSALYLEKEMQLVNKDITKYVLREDIDNYIDKVADDCVVVIELENFTRDIPDDLIDIVADTKDIFDQFYVVFTDYTGEERKKVEKEKRDKDPILFGNVFVDGRVSSKMYFIGDWVDEYCDLTLDKMIGEIAKKEKKKENEVVLDINDYSILDNIEKALFGSTKRLQSRQALEKKD